MVPEFLRSKARDPPRILGRCLRPAPARCLSSPGAHLRARYEALTVQHLQSVVTADRCELVPIPQTSHIPLGATPRGALHDLRPRASVGGIVLFWFTCASVWHGITVTRTRFPASHEVVNHVFLDLSTVDSSPNVLLPELDRRPVPVGLQLLHCSCTHFSIQRFRLHVGLVDLLVYLHGAHGAVPNHGLYPQELGQDVPRFAATKSRAHASGPRAVCVDFED